MQLPSIVTSNFERDLTDALQPIRGYVLASVLYAFFENGLYDELQRSPGVSADELAGRLLLDPRRTRALLKYLRNEAYLVEQSEEFRLSPRGELVGIYRSWYTMLIGGYGSTFGCIGHQLHSPDEYAGRDGTLVGIGSCGISQFDAIPLFRSLLQAMDRECRSVIDLGCGNALYLIELCKGWEHIEAWGVEPDARAIEQGREAVARAGLAERIHLFVSGAAEFLANPPPIRPDCFLFGFVLHELLEQLGEAKLRELLSAINQNFPTSHVAVIEVDGQIDSPAIRSHALGLAYYNPYFLIHAVTKQRLESLSYWRELFRLSGYQIVTEKKPSPLVDSTNLEVGFLLRPSGYH